MRFFKILLWKAYLDKGFSLLNYVKYLVAIVGVKALFDGLPMTYIFLLGFGYAIICIIIGRLWFHYKLIDTENEINNIFNPFQREVREILKNGKVFKI